MDQRGRPRLPNNYQFDALLQWKLVLFIINVTQFMLQCRTTSQETANNSRARVSIIISFSSNFAFNTVAHVAWRRRRTRDFEKRCACELRAPALSVTTKFRCVRYLPRPPRFVMSKGGTSPVQLQQVLKRHLDKLSCCGRSENHLDERFAKMNRLPVNTAGSHVCCARGESDFFGVGIPFSLIQI